MFAVACGLHCAREIEDDTDVFTLLVHLESVQALYKNFDESNARRY